MLMPDRRVIHGLLARYRAHEIQVLSNPLDPALRQCFEDTAYTLCVLLGVRTAPEAVLAAERYVAVARRRPAAPSPSAASADRA